MILAEGNRVLVNLAPFIGSRKASSQTVPCTVGTVRDGELEVTPEPPYRAVTLWVDRRWVERGCADQHERLGTVHS